MLVAFERASYRLGLVLLVVEELVAPVEPLMPLLEVDGVAYVALPVAVVEAVVVEAALLVSVDGVVDEL